MKKEDMWRYGKGLGLWQEPQLTPEQQKEKSLMLANMRHEQDAEILRRIEANQASAKPVYNPIPEINSSHERLKSIIENTPSKFKIKNNIDADSSKPAIEVAAFNPVESGEIYDQMGIKYGIDPDWLKAIAYMENTHGYYDAIPPFNLVGTSYRPMNVQYKTWQPLADELGFSEWQIQYRVECNVELAALILKRIMYRVESPTLEKVASIYNYIGRENVSDYGARVGQIYKERLWEH
ncbi:hypothetical protein [Vibrio harveyi]|uniref:hypothetical protein n=1 Tax=Vibrio harveyi TaxID=669 RepID=UPI003CE85895